MDLWTVLCVIYQYVDIIILLKIVATNLSVFARTIVRAIWQGERRMGT